MTSAPVPFVIVTVCDLPCVATRCFPYASDVFEIVRAVAADAAVGTRTVSAGDQRNNDAERADTPKKPVAAEQIDSPESDTRRFMPLATVTGIDLPRARDLRSRSVTGEITQVVARRYGYSPIDCSGIEKKSAANSKLASGSQLHAKCWISAAVRRPRPRGRARSAALRPGRRRRRRPTPARPSPRRSRSRARRRACARRRSTPNRRRSASLSRAPATPSALRRSCSCVAASKSAWPAISAGARREHRLELRAVLVPLGEQLGRSDAGARVDLRLRPRVDWRGRPCRPFTTSSVTPTRCASTSCARHSRRRGRRRVERRRRRARSTTSRTRAAQLACRRRRETQTSGAPLARNDCAFDHAASTTAQTAPARSTAVIDVAWPTQPPTSTPTGTVPPKPMIHSAMTRPRSSSTRCDWMQRRQRGDRDEVRVAEQQRDRIRERRPAQQREDREHRREREERRAAAASPSSTRANTVPTLTAPSAAPRPKHA